MPRRRRALPDTGSTGKEKGGAQQAAPPSMPPSRSRVWCFRAAAVVAALLLCFPGLEVILRLARFGYPTSFFLQAKKEGQKIAVQNDRFGWRFFGPEMARTPYPFAIPERKPKDTVRIFVLGESAAAGDPSPDFGLARFLKALLEGRFPDIKFEVVSTAMTAINSHVIVPIARDCATQHADLWVIYMGNNEVVGPFGAATVFGPKTPSLAFIQASLALKTTRTGQLLDELLRHLRKTPAAEEQWGGMTMFAQNLVSQGDPHLASVYAHFQHNLNIILRIGQESGARIVVSTVASNLKDCAPFASTHRPGLLPAQLTEWEKEFQKGVDAQHEGRSQEAVVHFEQAGTLDGEFAELQFRWGQSCLALGEAVSALRHFTAARDLDALRFRADSRINEIIRQEALKAKAGGVLLVDAEKALASASPKGVPGDEFFYEHVHLDFEGNYLLARTIAEQLVKALTDQVPALAEGTGSWPSVDDCARRLAWTDWNLLHAETQIIGRMGEPPFTMQFDHVERIQNLADKLTKLQPSRQPEDLRRAATRCSDALLTFPDDWVLLKNRATLLQEAGDFRGAAESWRGVTQHLPHYPDAWQKLGDNLAEAGQDQAATEAFHRALEVDPEYFSAWFGLGQIQSRQGDYNAAIECFGRVLKLKPHHSLAHWQLGRTFQATGKPRQAEQQFHEALANLERTSSTLKLLGKLCFDRKWYKDAVTNFADALQLNPVDVAAHLGLARSLAALGQASDAQQHIADALRIDPASAEGHFELGSALGRAGDAAGAEREFATCLQLAPQWLAARLNLGVAFMQQKRRKEAIEQFQTVLQQEPTNAVARRYLQIVESQGAVQGAPQ